MTSGDQRVVVRATTAEDAARLREIRLEALADSPAAFGTTLADARAYDAERWVSMAESGASMLALVGDRAVGMAAGGTHDQRPGSRWLYGMYVTPTERGRGVADALVDAVADRARAEGAGELYLQVTEVMGRARAFYARRGFEPTGERHPLRRDSRIHLETLALPLRREPVRVARVSPHVLYDLRARVLRDGDVSRAANPRDDEPSTWHFAGQFGESVVASASLYPSTWPLDDTLDALQLRYMAVDPSVQGRGVGRVLLVQAEAIVRANGVVRIWAHARDSAVGFYRALGWGVLPHSEHRSAETGLAHTTMTRTLDVDDPASR